MTKLPARWRHEAIAVPDVAHRTLGTKAFTAILGLLAYLLASVAYVSVERSRIHDIIVSLEALGRHEQALARAEASVATASIDAERLAEQRRALAARYERQYDTVTVSSWLLSLVGLAWFGTLATWFFARLTRDIRRLEAHARRVVQGARGSPLVVDRDDELGRLMQAVNRMSMDLDAREHELALQAQRRSHRDKMSTVGALAAGVAHEVNNPLAVIAGLAERIVAAEAALPSSTLVETARQILAQSQRAAQVARQLAEVAASHPTEHDWVDLNSLVRRVAQLMAYDRRYRRVDVELQLDPDLPALKTDADAVQHALMQVLAVGCVGADGQPPMRVRLGTRAVAPSRLEVWLALPAGAGPAPAQWSHDLALARAILRSQQGDVEAGQDEMGSLPTTITIQLQSLDQPE